MCQDRFAKTIAGSHIIAVPCALIIGLLTSGIDAQQRGAVVPWIQYEAEDGTVAGGAVVIGPSRELGTPAGEASGRRAVLLDTQGASVSWQAHADANSIVLRHCIPDAPGGGGIDATLSLYVNDQYQADLHLTSRNAWIYGDYAHQYDNPASGPARKVYSEAHLLFDGFSIRQGDRVMLRKDEGDHAAYYAIDLIDLEQVAPPIAKPDGYISITESGHHWEPAIPDDDIPDDNAINQCIWAAQAGQYAGVYIPRGTFVQSNKFQTQTVKVQGAGMWYSRIYCPATGEDPGWGQTGFIINGDGSQFSDFAIFGWGGLRTQGGKAWVNSARRNTVIERMWVENVQCAYWVGGPQESTELVIRDCRFRNTGADAVNLCNGNLRSVIENCHARNTGDDAFAIWSARDLYNQPCVDNVIRNCTVQITWRAACFAIYGGRNNRIENCLGSDALTYPGLTVSSEFNPYPMESATVDGLTLERCGAAYWTPDQYFGAVWLFAASESFANVTIRNVDIIEPTYQAVHLQSGSHAFVNTRLEDITIVNPGQCGVQVKSGAMGSVTLYNVVMAGDNGAPRLINDAHGFEISDQGASARRPDGGAENLLSFDPARITVQDGAVHYSLSAHDAGAPVRLTLHALNGRCVATLAQGMQRPGSYRARIDRLTIPAGVYLACLQVGGRNSALRMTIR